MKIKTIVVLSVLALASALQAAEFNVATNGSDSNPGTPALPLRTIQRAADLAQPGDVITVHEGIYRERVNPPRGGESDAKRITYQAAPGEKVVITGSEPVKNWINVTNDTWKAVIPNSFFGDFNPYTNLIHGDWFSPMGRENHTGAVYLNGDWLTEAAHFHDVLKPARARPLWFGIVTNGTTSMWAQFKGVNPNEQSVEINVRQTVFTPTKTGVNYLTVRGFDLRDAATPWAPPTAGQIGIISAYWCKGWIIENNTISYSTCCGVALGKYSDEWDNRAQSAVGYVGTIHRALTNGWNKATVGSHIVRNNEISHCEQTGVVGSLGCSFSTVIGNNIHDIHVRGLFGGAEIAGIKFHGAIDVTISRNNVYRCGGAGGLWLDWMAQGAQVIGNLFHDNSQDFFFEMQHGPILVANNLFLSKRIALNSQGVAFAHNLVTGLILNDRGDKRSTPFMFAHSTQLAGLYPAANGDSGDHRFYNNLFIAPCSLHAFDNSALPCFAAGNVFTKGSQPSKFDTAALIKPNFDPGVKLTEKPDGWYLTINEDMAWRNEAKRKLVTTHLLGKAKVPHCAYENADGSPVRINTDYFGNKRNKRNPFPGPFEISAGGTQTFKVWPVSMR
ncbi:MAG TPA: right-handed parallel beta-helix repeat-containing protein [Candidatus Sulfotelmatobacter sp.]|nr:right-handed parallel beta-helix repeat-containing protein [Candidatus Sulfotelmatobacter sp.]